jgi:DNA invertase Pin-like site-specific DNA recombinase
VISELIYDTIKGGEKMKKVTKIDSIQQKSNKLRVAAYCRVSTDCDAQLESLDAQKQHYESYIVARSDWQFAGLYYDEGITGTKKEKRPELMRLIQDCEAKKIDFIITKSISRFSRNTTDCLELVRKLLELGIPIYFEKENINTGSMESELFLTILSSMAEGESFSISENIKWSIKRRFQSGTFKLSYAPYGYRWDGRTLRILPEQAKVVKRIFADVLSGKGTETIAKELNKESVPSKKGGHWTSTTIRNILSNEKYTGDVIFQKYYTDDSFNSHVNYGQVDRYYMPNHHEAIISKDDFEAASTIVAQRALEKGITKGSTQYQKRYAFSGKIICGECGNKFRRRLHTSTYKKDIAWCCNTHLSDKSQCSMLFIKDEDIKIAFTTLLNKLIYSHKLVLKPYVVSLQNNSSDDNVHRIQHLENLLAQNTEQRETLSKLMAQGYIDQIVFNRENNELLTQAAVYHNDINVINATMTGDNSKRVDAERLLHFVERGSMLNSFDEELFTRFVDHIQVYSRHELGFIMKCGLTLKEMI